MIVCAVVLQPYLIFVIFLHGHYFWLKFSPHNRALIATNLFCKKLFATKQLQMQQNIINCTHNEGDFRFLHICHVVKCEINPHVEKLTDIFSTDTVSVSVTNIRHQVCLQLKSDCKEKYFLFIIQVMTRSC